MSDTLIPEEQLTLEQVMEKYRPLLVKLASEYTRKANNNVLLPYEDMYQEAVIAMEKALKAFKPETGVFLGYFLKFVIINHLKCVVRDVLPHRYIKDDDKSKKAGTNKFKWVQVSVGSLEDYSDADGRVRMNKND